MKIVLSDTKTIQEIKKEFNCEFPYLKIEFFDVPYKPEAPTPQSKMFSAERKLSLCRKIHIDGALDLTASKTVAEIEKELWERFGLSVQIFRKTGNLWIETNLTEAWTLERQNNEGRELRFNSPDGMDGNDDPNDRDVWR